MEGGRGPGVDRLTRWWVDAAASLWARVVCAMGGRVVVAGEGIQSDRGA